MSGRTVVYLTPEGFQALEKELAFLTTVRRQEVAARLHGALSEGELIENAELEEARREQAFPTVHPLAVVITNPWHRKLSSTGSVAEQRATPSVKVMKKLKHSGRQAKWE